MLKIYSFVLTVIIAISPIIIYYVSILPLNNLVDTQLEQLAKAKIEVEKAEFVISKNKKLEDDINGLKDLSDKQLVELNKKNDEIKALDEDFKKLFSEEEKLNSEIKKLKEINTSLQGTQKLQEEKIAELNSKTGTVTTTEVNLSPKKDDIQKDDIQKSMELDLFSFLTEKNVGSVGVPFFKGSDIPDLKKLFETTGNKNIKDVILTCPKEYYQTSQDKGRTIIKALIRGFCSGNKVENCDDNTKTKINELMSNTGVLTTYGFHYITKYESGNPGNFQERVIVYYNENGEKVCSMIGTKKGGTEYFIKLK